MRLINSLVFLISSLISVDLFAIDSDRDSLPDDWELANCSDANLPNYHLSVYGDHTCAYDDTGFRCWGDRDLYNPGDFVVPPLSKPIQFSTGGLHDCALDATGVQCWGFNQHGPGNFERYQRYTV